MTELPKVRRDKVRVLEDALENCAEKGKTMGIWKRKKKPGEAESQEMESQTLSDIIRGMQYCVNTAADITEEHYVNQLSQYFREDHSPVMFEYRNNAGEIIQVPVFTLMNHTELLMDEVKLEMSVPIRYSELKKSEFTDKAIDDFIVSRSAFYLDNLTTDFSRDGRDIKIEMKFKSGKRPEAVSRIVDELMNTGVVRRTFRGTAGRQEDKDGER